MIHDSWKQFLETEFKKPYFQELSSFLKDAYANKTIFPPREAVFRAFSTDLNDVKVVILGQDPYHTPGAAMGLAFSVPSTEKIPPSLINIYKEIDSDLGQIYNDLKVMNPNLDITPDDYKHHNDSGDLSNWAKQGVLLLNNVLTVEAHIAGSHRGKGWEIFTEEVIKYLNDYCSHLVFILWGRDARSKKPLIDERKHLIIESAHPSPLSAHAGFFGSRPFSRTNEFLKQNGLSPIVW
ncbi:uracil-DNA glycosylase [Candidatus Saccharibacteria bacterium]|nr:uracil-DNA glycosylase [Candidatus Saccharibacteria bacterium]